MTFCKERSPVLKISCQFDKLFRRKCQTFKGAFGCRKTISGKYIFSGNANFRKRKMFSAVWLSRKSFSGKSFPVFGWSKHFTEIVLRKINSSVWFVQKFYRKYLTEIVLRKINSSVWFVQKFYGKFLTENHFQCLVCGSILQKI